MSKAKDYDPARFVPYLRGLVKARGESNRSVSLRAGLDHGAVTRFLQGRKAPRRDTCLLLANALDTDPNEMLVMAGYEPLAMLDRSLVDPKELPPDVKEFAAALKQIPPARRRAMFRAIRTLAQADFEGEA